LSSVCSRRACCPGAADSRSMPIPIRSCILARCPADEARFRSSASEAGYQGITKHKADPASPRLIARKGPQWIQWPRARRVALRPTRLHCDRLQREIRGGSLFPTAGVLAVETVRSSRMRCEIGRLCVHADRRVGRDVAHRQRADGDARLPFDRRGASLLHAGE